MNQLATEVQLVIPNVRASFLYCFAPFKNPRDPNAKATHTCHGLMEPGHPAIELIKNAQRQVAKAAWGENLITVTNDDGSNPRQVPEWQAELERLAQKDLVCLHSGARSKPGKEEYAGKFFISANNGKKPRVVATKNGVNVEVQAGDPLAPYSGCYVNMIVSIYAQSPKNKPSQWGRRINAQLLGVGFAGHGAAFGGGRVASVDEFPAVAEQADGAAPTQAGPVNDLV